jgi:hypothetical protein
MEFDFSKLLGLITEKYGTRSAFAAAMGMADSAFSNRINNKICFDTVEIYQACQLLGIDAQDIPVYFFTPKVL